MVPVHQETDLEAAFATIATDRPNALLLTGDPVILLHLKRITDFAAKHRLPTGSYVRTLVDEGGLMSYGPNVGDLMRRSVSYVDRVLKGAKPAELPVEQPTKLEFVINLRPPKAIGLTIRRCWRERIRSSSEPTPVPCCRGSRGAADPVDPNDDLRRGYLADRQAGSHSTLTAGFTRRRSDGWRMPKNEPGRGGDQRV
jgi:hypothetical protein